MQGDYDAFRQRIDAQWGAARRRRHRTEERLYERVLFRLVDQPELALAHLVALMQETRDEEIRAWYQPFVRELTLLTSLL